MRTFLRTAILAAFSSIVLAGQGSIAGEWMVTVHEQFGPNVMRLSLTASGETVSGTFAGPQARGDAPRKHARVEGRQRSP